MYLTNSGGALSPSKQALRQELQTLISSIQGGNFSYIDELYRLLATRRSSFLTIGDMLIRYINGKEKASVERFNEIAREYRKVASSNYQIMDELYSSFEQISNLILSHAESTASDLAGCRTLLKAAEGVTKKKASASSIKDELLHYDTLGQDSTVRAGTLLLDTRAGQLTLGILSSESVPFTVDSVVCNRTSGALVKGLYGRRTVDCLQNGYFTSRVFSTFPLLTQSNEIASSALCDSDLATAMDIEYNSFANNTPLVVTVKLRPSRPSVGVAYLLGNPGDMTAVSQSAGSLPLLTRMSVKPLGAASQDLTAQLQDNRIDIQSIQVGDIEQQFSHAAGDPYPSCTCVLNRNNVELLEFEISATYPQIIFYPEIVAKGQSGNTVKRFNYFESLLLSGYRAPEGYVDPSTLFTDSQRSLLYETYAAAIETVQESIRLYRYFIGLKEIQLVDPVYSTTGETVSKNLNTSGRKIAAADLFVSDSVPEGTSISYMFSHDLINWYEMLPSNRTGDGTKRLVFTDLDVTAGDMKVDADTADLYLKITMAGTSKLTPVLKAYAVRIKLA